MIRYNSKDDEEKDVGFFGLAGVTGSDSAGEVVQQLDARISKHVMPLVLFTALQHWLWSHLLVFSRQWKLG